MAKGNYNFFTLDSDGKIIGYSNKDYAMNPQQGNEAEGSRVGYKPLAVISADSYADDTIISLPVILLDNDYIKKGDKLVVLNQNTLEDIHEFLCSADSSNGALTISVDSTVLTANILAGNIISIKLTDKLYSDKLQIGSGNSYEFTQILKVRTNSATIAEATTDGLTGDETRNRIIVPENSAMECKFEYVVCKQTTIDIGRMSRRAMFKNVGGTVTLNAPATTPYPDEINPLIVGIAATIGANNTYPCVKAEFTGLNLTLLNCTISVHCIVSKYG